MKTELAKIQLRQKEEEEETIAPIGWLFERQQCVFEDRYSFWIVASHWALVEALEQRIFIKKSQDSSNVSSAQWPA